MTQPPDNNSLVPSPAASRTKMAAWIAIGAGLAAGLAILAFFGLRAAGVLAPLIPPVPACGEPKLALGATKFRVQPVARGADGSVVLPQDSLGVAYWVEGTGVNYVFVLSAAGPHRLLKDQVKAGDAAVITWADCGSDEYQVQSVEAGLPDQAALYDQSTGGITVFVQDSPAGQGLTIKGGRRAVQVAETPGLVQENEIQADITFLSDTAAADGQSVRIGVSILNRGPRPISLTANDISLTPENAAPIPLLSVEPALPREIKPGADETFYLTFARPGVNVAVLRILTFSSDHYF